MSQRRQCWSARMSIIKKKKLMELENAMFRQGGSMELTPLRLVKGELPRRKQTVEDLERGWRNSYKGDFSKQPSSKALACFGFKDKDMRSNHFKNELDKPKEDEKVDKGWVTNFRDQKTKELDEVYGKDSTTMKSIGKTLQTASVGNCKEERSGTLGRPRVEVAELHKASFEKPQGSPSMSTSRATGSPTERSERFLDAVWVRSHKGVEADSLSMDTSYGDISDAYAHAYRHENEKDLDVDMGWMIMRSPRREASGQGEAKAVEEMIKEREDKLRKNSWFNGYHDGQTRKFLGLRSYSIGDYQSKKVNEADLSWAANCRAKLKAQITAAA